MDGGHHVPLVDGGQQVHPTLFGAVGCPPGSVLVNNVVSVGNGGAGIGKRAENGSSSYPQCLGK